MTTNTGVRAAVLGGLTAASLLAACSSSGGGQQPSIAVTPVGSTTVSAVTSNSGTTSVLPASPSSLASKASTSATSTRASNAAVRGVLQDHAWWIAHASSAPVSACAAYGEDDTTIAWRLSGGQTVCMSGLSFDNTVWKDHVINLDLYFSGAVSAKTALARAAKLLPLDIKAAGTYPGVNNDASAKPNGSCMQYVFTSSAAKVAVLALNPGWAGAEKVSVSLYSGVISADNGAEKPYNANRVTLALVGIGGENRGADGVVHC